MKIEGNMYRYPDPDDENFNKNIITPEWDDGNLEKLYLEESIKLISPDNRVNFLDAGCGRGRLLPIFGDIFKRGVAVDPDVKRLQDAIGVTKEFDPKKCAIKFSNVSVQKFETDETFDCILCSHVIQHVATNDIAIILKKIRDLLKKSNGKLILSTTNWKEKDDIFYVIHSLNNKQKVVSQIEFDECVEQNNDWLPVRYFTERSLRQLLENAGFKIIFLKKYHGYPRIRGDNFIFAAPE